MGTSNNSRYLFGHFLPPCTLVGQNNFVLQVFIILMPTVPPTYLDVSLNSMHRVRNNSAINLHTFSA